MEILDGTRYKIYSNWIEYRFLPYKYRPLYMEIVETQNINADRLFSVDDLIKKDIYSKDLILEFMTFCIKEGTILENSDAVSHDYFNLKID
jgi:hypothetical protein